MASRRSWFARSRSATACGAAASVGAARPSAASEEARSSLFAHAGGHLVLTEAERRSMRYEARPSRAFFPVSHARPLSTVFGPEMRLIAAPRPRLFAPSVSRLCHTLVAPLGADHDD